MKTRQRAAVIGLLTVVSLTAAACGSDDETATTDAPAVTEAPADTDAPAETDAPVDTEAPSEAVCPTNVVIQTDWWPEAEHGGTYQLIGPDGTADAETFVYSGPVQDAYKVGGVETIEIRAGGDAVGFQGGDALLAADDDIMFAYVTTSDIMKASDSVPLLAVAKTLDLDPQMIMWDPTQHTITKPEDIAATGAQLLYFDGASYVDYMVGAGYLTEDQRNPSYGGAPDQWIAEGGNYFQQGFATNEVYKYENIIEWKDGAPADVEFYTVGDLGFPNYPGVMAIRADRLEEFRPCLEVLVPALSQAWIDYFNDPTPVNDALIGVNDTYDTYWKITAELNAAAVELMDEKGFSANSPDGTYCSFDPERIQALADILTPIYEEQGVSVAQDMSTTYTNEFCEGAPGR